MERQDTVQRAIVFNRSMEHRSAAAGVLSSSEDDPALHSNQSSTLSPTPSMADLTHPHEQPKESVAASRADSGELSEASQAHLPDAAQQAQAQAAPVPTSHDDSAHETPQVASQTARTAADPDDDGSLSVTSSAADLEGSTAVHEPSLQEAQPRRQRHLPIALAFGSAPGNADARSARPALLRQEAEGGKLLVSALLRCTHAGATGSDIFSVAMAADNV